MSLIDMNKHLDAIETELQSIEVDITQIRHRLEVMRRLPRNPGHYYRASDGDYDRVSCQMHDYDGPAPCPHCHAWERTMP